MNTPTLLTEGTSSADATSYATASVTPTSGARVLLWVFSGRTDGAAAPATGATGAGLGSVEVVTSQVSASGNMCVTLISAVGNGSAGAITINFGTQQLNCMWKMIEHVGASTATITNYISSQGVSTATGTLPSAPAADSYTHGVLMVNSTSQTPTVGSGYTQIGTTQTQSTPSVNNTAEYRTGSTSQTVNMTPAGTSQNVFVGVELENASSPLPVASKEITVTHVIANGGSATQDTAIDYGASTNTTSIAVDTVSGGGLVVGDIDVTGLVLSFVDDPARTDSVAIGVTLTGAGGTTADTVTVPPLGSPSGIRTRVWVSPGEWA